MKFFLVAAIASLAVMVSGEAAPKAAVGAAPTIPAGPPTIKWGKCPQLEPTTKDKQAKAKVLEACLKEHPAPTEELFKKDAKKYEKSFFEHQSGLASCALKKEDWFNKDGTYKYKKAEEEIKKKKLSKDMEGALLKAHEKCRNEAKAFVSDKTKKAAVGVEQVQFYQACMDQAITVGCGIEIVPAVRQ